MATSNIDNEQCIIILTSVGVLYVMCTGGQSSMIVYVLVPRKCNNDSNEITIHHRYPFGVGVEGIDCLAPRWILRYDLVTCFGSTLALLLASIRYNYM